MSTAAQMVRDGIAAVAGPDSVIGLLARYYPRRIQWMRSQSRRAA